MVKAQNKLLPAKQLEFLQRLDPEAKNNHGFYGPLGDDKKMKEKFGILGSRRRYGIPGTEGVQLVGRKFEAGDYYGLKDIYVDALTHADLQVNPLSADERSKGNARFVSFHFDGAIYGAIPSRVTTLYCVKLPEGPPVTIRWDDGTGQTMRAAPGLTAFFNTAQLYSLLTDEEKALVEHSRWEPAPHPFVWSGTRKFRPSGCGVARGGEVGDGVLTVSYCFAHYRPPGVSTSRATRLHACAGISVSDGLDQPCDGRKELAHLF